MLTRTKYLETMDVLCSPVPGGSMERENTILRNMPYTAPYMYGTATVVIENVSADCDAIGEMASHLSLRAAISDAYMTMHIYPHGNGRIDVIFRLAVSGPVPTQETTQA